MNCDEASQAIAQSVADADGVLAPDIIEHIDNCDDCNMAFLNSIADGLDSGGLKTLPMPARLRAELGIIEGPGDRIGFWTRLKQAFRTPPARFALQSLGSACVIAILLLVFRPRLFTANGNSSDQMQRQLASARGELEDEKTKLQTANQKANDLARQQQSAQIIATEEKKKREMLTAQVDQLEKKIAAGAASKVTEVGNGVYRDSNGGLVFTKSVPHEDEKTVIAAVTTGDVSIPPRIGELNEHAALMGDNGSTPTTVSILSPDGTFVSSNRPVFRWKQRNHGRYYRLKLMSVSPRELVATVFVSSLRNGEWAVNEYGRDLSQPSKGYKSNSGTEWNPAESGNSDMLQPGKAYKWLVEELDKPGEDGAVIGKSGYAAEFQVADATAAAQFTQGHSLYGSSHLLLGAYYASHGFIDDARKELDLEPDKKAAAQVLKRLPKAP